MNINTDMLKAGNYKKYDRLYDNKRGYIGSIISVDLNKCIAWIRYRIHDFPIDINKLI